MSAQEMLLVLVWGDGVIVGCMLGYAACRVADRWVRKMSARISAQHDRRRREELAARYEAMGAHSDAARVRAEEIH